MELETAARNNIGVACTPDQEESPGLWSPIEEINFERGVIEHGRDWDKVAQVVGSRDRFQVETFYIKHYAHKNQTTPASESPEWTPWETSLLEHGIMKHGHNLEKVASAVGTRNRAEVEGYMRLGNGKVPKNGEQEVSLLKRGDPARHPPESPHDYPRFDTSEEEDSEDECDVDPSSLPQNTPSYTFPSFTDSVTKSGLLSPAYPVDEMIRPATDRDATETTVPHKDHQEEEHDDDEEEKPHWSPDPSERELLTIPSYEGQISQRYFLTGLQYYGFKHGSSLQCLCRHCGGARVYSNVENFAKSIAHLSLHLTRNCPCPKELKEALEEAFEIKHPPGTVLANPELGKLVWARQFPSRDILPLSRGYFSHSNKSPSVGKPRPSTNTPQKRSIASKIEYTEVGPSVRLKRTATLTSSQQNCDDNIDQDKENPDTGNIVHSVPGRVLPLSQMLQDMDDVKNEDLERIVEDGHLPIALMFKTVTKYGRDELKRICVRMRKESRQARIWKLVKRISDTVDKGYDLVLLIDALERIRAGRSVHSFVDYINEAFQEAEASLVGVVPTSANTAKTKLLLETDPSEHFIEETAFIFHDPKTSQECLHLPEEPKDDLEPLPNTGDSLFFLNETGLKNRISFKWHFEEDHRVIMCDFHGLKYDSLTMFDLEFFGRLLECDHVTVISDGLFESDELDLDLWDLKAIQLDVGDRIHHKFKRFVRHPDNPAIFSETGEMLEGPISTFVDYVTRHQSEEISEGEMVEFNGTEGRAAVSVDVKRDALYMIDFDLPRILPRNYDDFMDNFKIHEVLPGGKWCMMNCLPKSARPFMGPNMYVTPGGAYTHLHQDGNGTVDSGHCVLSGYNEVVMLRRLPERHKAEASKLLPNRGGYDALYTFPHEGGKKPDWPTNEAIESWRRMGYCPSVFVLKPGQHVHINKGRLHAFRKMTAEPLPSHDCHFELRRNLLKDGKIQKLPLCISVAWDWQFVGISPDAINREVTSALECQLLVDKRFDMKCLAIPKVCLLAMGKSCQSLELESRFQMVPRKKNKPTDAKCVLRREAMLRGIAPALMFVLEQNIAFIQAASKKIDWKLKVAQTNDTALNPLASTVDPDGNDYFCKLCNRELENVYLHCDGCEELLQKDFNICMDCHEHGHWRKTVDMLGRGLVSPLFQTSSINHTGGFCYRGSCSCAHGRQCHGCQRCNACNCTCHASFTVRRRFYDLNQLLEIVGWLRSRGIESLEYGHLTTPRLLVAADRGGRGYHAMRKLIKEYPQLFPRNTEQDKKIAEEGEVMSSSATPSITSEVDAEHRSEENTAISGETDVVLEEGHGSLSKPSTYVLECEESPACPTKLENHEPATSDASFKEAICLEEDWLTQGADTRGRSEKRGLETPLSSELGAEPERRRSKRQRNGLRISYPSPGSSQVTSSDAEENDNDSLLTSQSRDGASGGDPVEQNKDKIPNPAKSGMMSPYSMDL